MTRPLLALLLLAPAAVAQVPYSYPSPYGPIPGPQSFAPNYYNRSTQPVNPYLNLLNSANPALSYYYGVRPGTMGPNNLGPVFGSGAPLAPPVGRTMFLPPPVAVDRDQTFDVTPRTSLPSPGGPVAYGNFFGSSRVGVNNSPRTGFMGSTGGGAASGSTIPRAPTGTGSGGPGIPKIR